MKLLFEIARHADITTTNGISFFASNSIAQKGDEAANCHQNQRQSSIDCSEHYLNSLKWFHSWIQQHSATQINQLSRQSPTEDNRKCHNTAKQAWMCKSRLKLKYFPTKYRLWWLGIRRFIAGAPKLHAAQTHKYKSNRCNYPTMTRALFASFTFQINYFIWKDRNLSGLHSACVNRTAHPDNKLTRI